MPMTPMIKGFYFHEKEVMGGKYKYSKFHMDMTEKRGGAGAFLPKLPSKPT